MHVLKKF